MNSSKVPSAWAWQNRDWNSSLVHSFKPPVGPGHQGWGGGADSSVPGKWLEGSWKSKNGSCLYSQLPACGRSQYKYINAATAATRCIIFISLFLNTILMSILACFYKSFFFLF